MRDIERDLSATDAALDEAIEAVTPPALGRAARDAVESADPDPALLCTLAAPEDALPAEEAVGVQLLHTGLTLTRGVIDEPAAWEDADADVTDEDMDLLAADVLVTLGFDHLIAHYDAATRVVTTFGRETARALDADDPERAVDRVAASYGAAYRAAVSIGADGDAREGLEALADAVARRDALRGSRHIERLLAPGERVDGVERADRDVEQRLEALDVPAGYRDALLADASWRAERPAVAEAGD